MADIKTQIEALAKKRSWLRKGLSNLFKEINRDLILAPYVTERFQTIVGISEGQNVIELVFCGNRLYLVDEPIETWTREELSDQHEATIELMDVSEIRFVLQRLPSAIEQMKREIESTLEDADEMQERLKLLLEKFQP